MTSVEPNTFVLFTVIFLYHGDQLLLLERSPTKRVTPNRWTGVGGKVEAHEFGDLRASALRELEEETSLTEADINHFSLHRTVYLARPGEPLTGILYYTAAFQGDAPACTEGTLHWKHPQDFAALDIIETTARTLPFLLEDLERDPHGDERVRLGIVHHASDPNRFFVSWNDIVEHPSVNC